MVCLEAPPFKPLPRISARIFCEIFLVNLVEYYQRLHELFSIFYYYRRTHPRAMRFLINYCKTMLFAGLCTQFAANIGLMLLGLFVVNWIENIAEILLRSPGRVSFVAGVCALLLMMGVALYLIINTFIGLLPDVHQIWLYTFIVVTLLEMFPIEFLMIAFKCVLQPHLHKVAYSENPILRVIYIAFWDVKVQTIWRRSHRLHQNALNRELMKHQNTHQMK